MNCCGVPPLSVAAGASIETREARDAVSAVLFREVLKPLASALGPFGDLAIDSIAGNVVRRP